MQIMVVTKPPIVVVWPACSWEKEQFDAIDFRKQILCIILTILAKALFCALLFIMLWDVVWGYAQGGRKDLGFAVHHGERKGTGKYFVIENNNT